MALLQASGPQRVTHSPPRLHSTFLRHIAWKPSCTALPLESLRMGYFPLIQDHPGAISQALLSKEIGSSAHATP